jgi:hypothetical protein
MAKASLFKEKHDTDNKPSCLISVGVKLNNTASIPAASLTAFGRLLPVAEGCNWSISTGLYRSALVQSGCK